MTFQAPYLLILLIIPVLLAIWSLIKQGKPATLRYADSTLLGSTRSWRLILRPFLPYLRWFALTLIIFALARPQLVETQEVIRGDGVDIALALDISGSMAALDFQPDNRLEAAKAVIADFVSQREYDRVGLVVFAQNAFNQSPPTIDHDVLLRLVEQVKLAPDLGVADGTAIGMGLANASNMLKDSTAESKVAILLTDGVNNGGQIDPQTAAEAAKTLGIKVYTIGAATTGQVPMPQRDIFGRETIAYQESVIDEVTLQQIAETTGGLYFRAENTDGLQQIYDQINELEKSEVEIQSFEQYQELATGWIEVALVVLLIELLLSRAILWQVP